MSEIPWVLRTVRERWPELATVDGGMQFGVDLGWWESFDAKGPIPFAKVVSIASLSPNATMAHALFSAGFIESISWGRKNGWGRPVQLGTFKVDKKRHSIKIVP
jgi:hypothetical protein